MSYCVFENGEQDLRTMLQQVLEAYDEGMTFGQFVKTRSSEHEGRAVRRVMELCQNLVDALGDLDDNISLQDEPDDSDYDRQTLRDAGMGSDEDY
jgi:hypothetical protein